MGSTERFTVVERELKTKTCSEEGLDDAQAVEPARHKQEEAPPAWLSNSVQGLGIHVDEFESDIESLALGLKKNIHPHRVAELKALLSRHQFHIAQRACWTAAPPTSVIKINIKEDDQYHIDSCQDPDFEENAFPYVTWACRTLRAS